jgi:hypothetical protein
MKGGERWSSGDGVIFMFCVVADSFGSCYFKTNLHHTVTNYVSVLENNFNSAKHKGSSLVSFKFNSCQAHMDKRDHYL